MKCLQCNHTKFVEQKIRFTPEIKGEIVEVIAPCMTCAACKSPLMNTEQMNVLRKASAEKYKELHDLLTSSQILAYREMFGMSQSAFARYLNVGEASVKRWETYFIQDESHDELIRLKCDEAIAEMNFLDIHWKRCEPDAFNGQRKFNFQIIKNVILYLTEHTHASKLFLNKLLFYTDFLHFKHFKISLTGARYAPLKYGPCPDQFQAIYNALINKGLLEESKKHTYNSKTSPDLSLFDDHEKQTLELVLSYYKEMGLQKIYDLSHKEEGYTKTEECSFINYQYASNLLLSYLSLWLKV